MDVGNQSNLVVLIVFIILNFLSLLLLLFLLILTNNHNFKFYNENLKMIFLKQVIQFNTQKLDNSMVKKLGHGNFNFE